MDKIRVVKTASENVMLFEFLLDPTLLERHLQKPKPDPSPFELIDKFMLIDQKNEINDVENTSKKERSHQIKAVALKILTMKVMAHLKWDLDALELKLPSKVILQLLLDLLSIATENEVKIDPFPTVEYRSDFDHQTIFAVLMFHRWILKALIFNSLAWKHPKLLFIPSQGGPDPNVMAAKKREEFRQLLEAQAPHSRNIICRVIDELPTLTVPTFQSFIQPTEGNPESRTKWLDGALIKAEELQCQLHFEIGQFLMFQREHEIARSHLMASLSLMEKLEKNPTLRSSFSFCLLEKEVLVALCVASDGPKPSKSEASSLLHRFKESKWNHYQDIIAILQMDNILREIPVADRDFVEVEIQQSISCGSLTVAKDLLMKLQILNGLRRVLDRCSPAVDLLSLLQGSAGDKAMDFFLTSIHSIIFDVPAAEQVHLKRFLFDLMLREQGKSHRQHRRSLTSVILADEAIRGLFSAAQLSEVTAVKQEFDLRPKQDISPELTSRSSRLEVMNIQHQLSDSFDPEEVRNLLKKLHERDPLKAWFKSNNRWDVPIPLQSAIVNLPKDFSQDFIYILIAKSRELNNRKDFKKAIIFLQTAGKEASIIQKVNSTAIYKVIRLIEWETLLVKINQYLEEFPDLSLNLNELTGECMSCIAASTAGEVVIPRLEILESCAIALLNLGEWDSLISMDKCQIYIELAAALAAACQDIIKYKGAKKMSRSVAWDLVLPVFGQAAQKRNASGTTVSPIVSTLTKASLVRFILQLREPRVLTAALSLLARLHNVLRDESNLEINFPHAGLWPAMVSNANSYNARLVAEVLTQVVVQALKFMPNDVLMLKLMGDLNFVVADWASALRYYLEAAAADSNFFAKVVPKNTLDDFVVKRMVKCCAQLNCYTQAAALCQCLDDIDYVTAFRCLSDTKNLNCSDAMDAYYPYLWDLTLLEYLVNMHSKRGEAQRKQRVIQIMGLLELNSNNNEEIQREAANVRRSQLLRSLMKQYSVSTGQFLPS